MTFILLLAAAAAPPPGETIVVTASLEPVRAEASPASATLIDERRIEALGPPLVSDLARLAPGVSVAVSGAQGSLTQIRIRGAEANHSLLFVDGIAFNDPASGNEARFETIAADGLSRVEIVRGPQSALWGSEALGGVIAVEGADPLSGTRLSASGEYGSRDFSRGHVGLVAGDGDAGVAASLTRLGGGGIDIFGGGSGDRDGFSNLSARLKAAFRPVRDGEVGIVGHHIRATSQFDGTPPPLFRRADTLDSSRSELGAVRAWARMGLAADAPWSFDLEGQYLHSSNRNRNGAVALNRTLADRLRIGGKLVRRFSAGGARHSLIAAAEREEESFAALDQAVFFAPDQRRSRGRTAYVGEWRAQWGAALSTDLAVRRDDFNRFEDSTNVRAAIVARPLDRLRLHAAYGEGIAQPTFFDLYGFDPTSFVGNPDLTSERSRGLEAGLAWEGARVALSATAFSNRLSGEIVEDFSTFPFTVRNAAGKSRRRGIEVSAEASPAAGLRVSANYTGLDARERRSGSGGRSAEPRRPRHGANLAADWTAGRLVAGASLAYVGKRGDSDFDVFPAAPVVLDDYLLANVRMAYRLSDWLELFGRVENAADSDYRDVFGYNSPGRSVHAGLRVRLGD
ncbi:MAG TPA: TonB-dependent receptor [Allosphingosinicella sp.]|jgi:vitamin B12 transporter|nr:TonB-dependent receptor [Allosphingosinicella sp.]